MIAALRSRYARALWLGGEFSRALGEMDAALAADDASPDDEIARMAREWRAPAASLARDLRLPDRELLALLPPAAPSRLLAEAGGAAQTRRGGSSLSVAAADVRAAVRDARVRRLRRR